MYIRKMIPLYHNETRWTFFNRNKLRFFYRSYRLIDKFRGTNFYSAQTSHPVLDGHHYATAFYPGLLAGIFRILPKSKIEGIIDIGSGKGLGIYIFKKCGISKVGGIEFQKELVEICHTNLAKMGIQGDFIYCGDAKDFMNYQGFNTLYLYNSLPCDILGETLKNFINYDKNQIGTKSSKYLISVNPVCHQIVLDLGFVEMGRFFHFAGHVTVIIYSKIRIESTVL